MRLISFEPEFYRALSSIGIISGGIKAYGQPRLSILHDQQLLILAVFASVQVLWDLLLGQPQAHLLRGCIKKVLVYE
jgi:hypothetical protein